jgi:DNA polymerase III delta subunit
MGLSKEIRTLSAIYEGTQQGIALSQLFQQHGVWSKQQAVITKSTQTPQWQTYATLK